MNWEPDWAAEQAAQTARKFANQTLVGASAARDRLGTFPEDEMRALGRLGLLGVCVPEDAGGTAMGAVALAMAVAEIARADASVAVTMAVTNMVAEILSRYGTPVARRRLLPGLCRGDAVSGSFALSESQAGSDAGAMTTTARDVPGGFRISGSKLWITSGDRSGVLVVVARHPLAGGASDVASARRMSAFVIEGGAVGLGVGQHEEKLGQRGSSTVPLTLDDVFVPDWALLGVPGQGFKVALAALDGGRINVAAQAVGIGRAALEVALSYARQRQQFGAPIASFAAIRFLLADSATALEAAWLLVLRAAWGKEKGESFTYAAAQAKLHASEKAVQVCESAMQVLGGYGYTRDFPMERFVRDVRVTTIYEGTSQIQRLVIAKHILRGFEHD